MDAHLPDGIVTVRLDVQFMRHSIVHAFNTHTREITALVESEVDRAIKNFDWRSEVAKIAGDVVRDLVKQQITTAMSHLRWDDALRKELSKSVLRELTGSDATPQA